VAKPSKDGTNSRPTVKSLTFFCKRNNIIFCIRIGDIYHLILYLKNVYIVTIKTLAKKVEKFVIDVHNTLR